MYTHFLFWLLRSSATVDVVDDDNDNGGGGDGDDDGFFSPFNFQWIRFLMHFKNKSPALDLKLNTIYVIAVFFVYR